MGDEKHDERPRKVRETAYLSGGMGGAGWFARVRFLAAGEEPGENLELVPAATPEQDWVAVPAPPTAAPPA